MAQKLAVSRANTFAATRVLRDAGRRASMPALVMPGPSRLGRGDAVALLTLLATAAVLSSPIWRGGYYTYIDNSVHIAEILELSRAGGNGWSELAFGGFPLDTLHSPIWYPLLASLTRAGLPVGLVYGAALLVGFVAMPLAVYAVARARGTATHATVLAYLALIQPALVWGIGSPLAGMWTNGLASAALVFLTVLYSRAALSAREHVAAAALVAFAVLTHLFVLPILVFLVAITTAIHHADDTLTTEELTRRGAGLAVAGLVSARYWLTFAMTTRPKSLPHQALHPLHVAARLFLPADPIYLGDNRLEEALRWDLGMVDALPIVLLLALGVVALFKEHGDPLVRTGGWLALAILGSLIVDRYRPLRMLGPVSWRLIESARMGMTLAAIPVVSSLPLARAPAALRGAAAAAGVALGAFWNAPLRHDSPPSTEDELVEVRELWAWLKEHATPAWGRLYLQDTFGWEWRRGGLAQSHALVLTKEATGLPQLGTYYGVVPYPLRWTLSEFDGFYKQRLPAREWILEATEKTNVGVVVSSSRSVYESVARTGDFEQLFATEHYAVWRRRDARDLPVTTLSPGDALSSARLDRGELAFDVTTEAELTRVLARVQYHQWWRVSGIPGARLRETPDGFMLIDQIPRGTHHALLRYEPSSLPGIVTLVGLAAFVGWAVTLLRRDAGTLAQEAA